MPWSSSLIFVAIIAAWGAYLLPRWVARRDALGQSRAQDRFSTGLRVLQRRPRNAATGPSASALLPNRVPSRTSDHEADRAARSASASVASAREVPGSSGAIARTATVSAARRRRRVLLACAAVTVSGWALFVLELAPWQVGAAGSGLLALDLLLLAVTAPQRAALRRLTARSAAAEVARAAAWQAYRAERTAGSRPAREAFDGLETSAVLLPNHRQPGRDAVVVAAAVASTTADGESGVRPVVPPPWPVDPADGVLLDDLAELSPREVAAAATWPQVDRRRADRRTALRDSTDRRGALGGRAARGAARRRLVAVERPEWWSPVAVPPPTYTLKATAPRPHLDRTADGVADEAAGVASAVAVQRPWQLERLPRGESAMDLDEILARRRAVNG